MDRFVTDFYATQLSELLSKIPQLLVVIHPGNNYVKLDFTEFNNKTNKQEKYKVYKNIIEVLKDTFKSTNFKVYGPCLLLLYKLMP